MESSVNLEAFSIWIGERFFLCIMDYWNDGVQEGINEDKSENMPKKRFHFLILTKVR